MLTLQPIEKGMRRDETSFWLAFGEAAPRILGVLLDGVVSALRNLPSVNVTDLPRMADFARWVAAAEPGLGLVPGTLLAAYERNRASVVDIALDASPVASALIRLLDQPRNRGRWRGEPAQLLAALNDVVVPDSAKSQPSWPKTANALSKALRRSASFLRSVRITIDLEGHEGRGDDKRRVWTVARSGFAKGVPSVPASPSSAHEDEARGRGDDGDASQQAPPDDGALAAPLNQPRYALDENDDDRAAFLAVEESEGANDD